MTIKLGHPSQSLTIPHHPSVLVVLSWNRAFYPTIEEVESPEAVTIYHHELHARKIKKSSILKLQVGSRLIEGHKAVSTFLEQSVEELLTTPADLCPVAQDSLLSEVKPVFTAEDNEMLNKDPTLSEVKKCVASSNMNAAPGNDGLTSFLYHHCWEIWGKASPRWQLRFTMEPPPVCLREHL